MSDTSLTQGNSVHQEDIAVLAAGTAIITRPCTIWNVIVSSDTTGAGSVAFSDHATTYTEANQKLKVVVNGADTKVIEFPKGLYLENGLTVTANKSSMNVSVVYD